MKLAVLSSLLAAILCATLVAASPLQSSDEFDTAVRGLGNYFNILAGELLRTEVARDRYNLYFHNTTDLLSSKFTELTQSARDLLLFSATASNQVLMALRDGTDSSEVPPECCSGDASPCCHRCSNVGSGPQGTALKNSIADVSSALSTAMDNLMDSSDTGISLEFATAQGPLVLHPNPSGTCSILDARTMPWYTFATSQPRTVAILVDLSFGISTTLKNTLVRGAQRLLSSLNPNDKVNVVLFGSNVRTVADCRQYTPANADNVRYFESFMYRNQDNILGIANTSSILSEAVDGVNAVKQSSKGEVIMFTSSYSVDYTDVLDIVRNNGDIKFSMAFFEDANVPPALISQANFKKYNMKTDAFSFIVDQLVLKDTSASSLDWMITVNNRTGERYVSIVQPRVVGTTLHGVFHSRIPLSLMTKAFVDYFGPKPVSYYFITDYPGMNVIYHPRAGKGTARSITELERLDMFRNNFTSEMKFTTTKMTSLALGPTERDGILNKDLTFTYTCRLLFNDTTGPNLPVVCAVVESSDSKDPMFNAVSGPVPNVVENQFTPPGASCDFFSYQANTGYSALRVSDSLVPTSAANSDVNAFIQRGQALDAPHSVRVDASVASQLTSAWRRTTVNSDIATWRHFGSYQGVYATYPAVTLPEEYNPKLSSWFRSASVPDSESGTVRFIPAQLNPFGTGYMYGITQKIQGNITYGVVSAALSLGSLVAYVEDNVPLCATNECVLFDDAGNLVYHNSFKSALPNTVQSLAESSRMTRFLSRVLEGATRSSDLCLDYANPGTIDRHFYNYELINRRVNGSSCPDYLAQRVPGTNVIFAVSSRDVCTYFCTCTDVCAHTTCPVFRTPEQRACQCRCRCEDGNTADDCSMTQDSGVLENAASCPAFIPNTPQYQPVQPAASGASLCQSTTCAAIQTNSTCLSSSSCVQCDVGCFPYSACCSSSPYTSGLLACTNRPTQSVPPTEPNIVAIVVPVVLVVVLIILLLLALVVWYNLRVKGKADNEHHTNVFDFSKEKGNKTNPEGAANGEDNHNTSSQAAKEKEAEAELGVLEPDNRDKEEEAEITEQTLQNDTKI